MPKVYSDLFELRLSLKKVSSFETLCKCCDDDEGEAPAIKNITKSFQKYPAKFIPEQIYLYEAKNNLKKST